jgi:hypothetical protein
MEKGVTHDGLVTMQNLFVRVIKSDNADAHDHF